MCKNLQKETMIHFGKPTWIIQMTKPPKGDQNDRVNI